MLKYIVLDKKIGETPLVTAENWRRQAGEKYQNVPLAYAGRLDPMASGKLLVLIGEECKKQTEYHGLDKSYEFSVLLGVGSDTGDVLGRLFLTENISKPTAATIKKITKDFLGEITLPYPHFSAKTVQGKPLHVWTLENRLDEIEIPRKTANIFKLKLDKIEVKSREEVYLEASAKVNSIPPVTDPRKQLGNDFRRVDVRQDWHNFLNTNNPTDTFYITHFTCIASSGAYMRTLAEEIAKKLKTKGLAFHIHRTHIGKYKKLPFGSGFWRKKY